MMPTYKNVGKSVWRRPTNEVVAPNATFQATPEEHKRIQRRTYLHVRLQLVSDEEAAPPEPTQPSTPPEVQEAAEPSQQQSVAEMLEWPIKMAPAQYLRLHSQGQHAQLARKIVKAEKAQAKAAAATEE